MTKKTRPYNVLTGKVYPFAFFSEWRRCFSTIEQHSEHHCQLHIFDDTVCVVNHGSMIVGYECFHTPSAGTDKREYRMQKVVIKQCTAHFHCLLIGIEMVDIYHHQM